MVSDEGWKSGRAVSCSLPGATTIQSGEFMDLRKYEKRRVLPGFPKYEKFKTKAEVDAYLGGEKIQCLLCGKWFHFLGGMHLKCIHGLAPDDYREMFGIPWNSGLIGAIKRESCVRQAKKLIEKGKLKPLVKGEPHPYGVSENKRPPPDCIRNRKGWRRKDFENILDRIREQQLPLSTVCEAPDLPSAEAWNRYAKKHPELKEKLLGIRENLPYAYQSMNKNLAPQLRADCERLRLEGMTYEDIGNTLDVSYWVVKRVLRGFDAKMGLPPVRPNKLTREDCEAILERVRDQQRGPTDVCSDPDLPGTKPWSEYVKKHPEFAAKIREVYHAMPYPFQARAGDLSPRFHVDCERLRATGMTMNNIAKALGVINPPVSRTLRDFNDKMGLARPKYRNWTREDFETILDRIRAQGRSLENVCRDPDLPSKNTWMRYTRKHPQFIEKLRDVHHSMPYSLQGRAKNMSPRFRVDCQRLFASGMTIESITKALGINRQAVERALVDYGERDAAIKSRKRRD